MCHKKFWLILRLAHMNPLAIWSTLDNVFIFVCIIHHALNWDFKTGIVGNPKDGFSLHHYQSHMIQLRNLLSSFYQAAGPHDRDADTFQQAAVKLPSHMIKLPTPFITPPSSCRITWSSCWHRSSRYTACIFNANMLSKYLDTQKLKSKQQWHKEEGKQGKSRCTSNWRTRSWTRSWNG